ncbi:Oxidoreductase molybdopterin binding domain protein [Maioricimonas rarisocia]|uniref:Oxidoreductase molybdopterin binding domain protein n=1 Tax=Maioricimonas rarisocia TaxID=2528026 RepID=A0A517Z1U2_9PLAN|nr:molybdopterin-dependent oxidoreductase [Maioricimonas rarisocia]QDU36379.1 Oxidoreductase molybdopterin binding domain protein [Maioricimonas rarisocia]
MSKSSGQTGAFVVTFEGAVRERRGWSLEDLLALPAEDLVQDISRLDSRRAGTAVKISALLDRMDLEPGATHLTLHSSSDGFTATVPIEAVRASGLLIIAFDGEPLPTRAGGPSRFFVPEAAACGSAELDACKNVKFVDRVEVVTGEA